MTTARHSANYTGQAAQARHFYLKVGVVVLLLAIAGFSTLAKNSQYFSRSNPAHYINISSKMKMSQLPVIIDQTPQRSVARFIPRQPETVIPKVVEDEIPALPAVGVTISLQHRSPPLSFS